MLENENCLNVGLNVKNYTISNFTYLFQVGFLNLKRYGRNMNFGEHIVNYPIFVDLVIKNKFLNILMVF